MIEHINALVLPVYDVKKCALFYRDSLGFDLDQLESDEAYLTTGVEGGPVLALKSVELTAKQISEDRIRLGESDIKRSHFVVFVEDIGKAYGDLVSKGVHFLRPPRVLPGGWSVAHFEDPECNLWEISQRPRR